MFERLFGKKAAVPTTAGLEPAREHHRAGRLAEAEAAFRALLQGDPGFAEAHYRLGSVLRDAGRFGEALSAFRRALELGFDPHVVHVALGNLLNDQGRPGEAISHYEQALALKPDYPDAHANLGNAYQYQGRLEEATACYERALALDPGYVEAQHNLGNALDALDRTDETLAAFRRTLTLDPEFVEARWALTMSHLPKVYASEGEAALRRAAFSRELDEMDRWFDSRRGPAGHRAVGIQQPFYLAYQEENNRPLLSRYGKLCARLMEQWAEQQTFAPPPARRGGDRIRVGIVSQCFWNHSVWNAFVRGWVEHLDRRRFSVHAFHLGAVEDAETGFARARVDHFEEGARGLRHWVDAIRGQQPDVLVYPDIGTDTIAVKLASLRLAPVQVNSWGHPETSGLPTMDYFLSAQDLEPAGAQENYSEKLVNLPHLGCCYRALPVAPGQPDFLGAGLHPDAALLVCPGTEFKYTPGHDAVLAEIARRLGRCQFVFFSHETRRSLSLKLLRRLGEAFARAGLDAADFLRIIPWQPRPAFYALLRRATAYLDTIGFSGFNTAMQATECGLPVVTREGPFLRGRLASGILRRMELPELVTESDEGYVALAVKLVQDPAYRERIRAQIVARRGVLFDDLAPIRALEDFLVDAVGHVVS